MPRPYSTDLTPAQRSDRARQAAYARLARHGARAAIAPVLAGRLASFEREVDPECVLPEAERIERARYAMKAHMARLALKSSRARAARRNAAA